MTRDSFATLLASCADCSDPRICAVASCASTMPSLASILRLYYEDSRLVRVFATRCLRSRAKEAPSCPPDAADSDADARVRSDPLFVSILNALRVVGSHASTDVEFVVTILAAQEVLRDEARVLVTLFHLLGEDESMRAFVRASIGAACARFTVAGMPTLARGL